jgi:hypothetical protein
MKKQKELLMSKKNRCRLSSVSIMNYKMTKLIPNTDTLNTFNLELLINTFEFDLPMYCRLYQTFKRELDVIPSFTKWSGLLHNLQEKILQS